MVDNYSSGKNSISSLCNCSERRKNCTINLASEKHFENADQNILLPFFTQAWIHFEHLYICMRKRNERKVQSAVAGGFLSERFDL